MFRFSLRGEKTMKPDEESLMLKLIKRGKSPRPSAWEVAESVGMPYKRARYILRDKWTGRGWYDYGISWRGGWLTPEMWSRLETWGNRK